MLQQRIDVTRQLCAALEAYLTFDVTHELAEDNNRLARPVEPECTAEDLIRASDYLQQLERQHQTILEGMESTPEPVRAMMTGAISLVMAPLENQIENAKKTIATIQGILEKGQSAT